MKSMMNAHMIRTPLSNRRQLIDGFRFRPASFERQNGFFGNPARRYRERRPTRGADPSGKGTSIGSPRMRGGSIGSHNEGVG
jgi:hypothetical protein